MSETKPCLTCPNREDCLPDSLLLQQGEGVVMIENDGSILWGYVAVNGRSAGNGSVTASAVEEFHPDMYAALQSCNKPTTYVETEERKFRKPKVTTKVVCTALSQTVGNINGSDVKEYFAKDREE